MGRSGLKTGAKPVFFVYDENVKGDCIPHFLA